jgi:hypothetical protein
MIPIVLFVYARPEHLRKTLECLKENKVPKIYIYSDIARTPDKEPAVKEVRDIIREIDWCETIIIERNINFGLGKSILEGVTEVLQKEEMVIVVEDDLVCVPGTYQYLSALLNHYKEDNRVMSVTGWTHPSITPEGITDQPYFDGRAECWVWGTWRRAWDGINDYTATSLIKLLDTSPSKYGYDLPEMAEIELQKNIWAVRFIYWHIVKKGLCLRPPWSMVNHIGFDNTGANVKGETWTKHDVLKPRPPIPVAWTEPLENSQCARLHKRMSGTIFTHFINMIYLRFLWRK